MPNEDWISREEASAILGVTPQAISAMVQRGVLRPSFAGSKFGGRVRYNRDEVVAALSVKEGKCPSLPEVAEIAKQALALAQHALREMRALGELIGVKAARLSMDDESIRALHLEVQDNLSEFVRGEDSINYWANKFMGMCDVYFQRVAEVMHIDNPWESYFALSTRLKKLADFDALTNDPALQIAYARLHFGRINLRQACSVYVITTEGKNRAKEIFPGDYDGVQHRLMLYSTMD